MDYFTSHWGAFTRRLPSRYQVQTIGYMPRKADWVRGSFASCNFSFIVQGGGDYLRAGKRWPVETPCVLTQWAGEYLEYGPGGGHATWEELYLIYRAETMDRFTECGFVRAERPIWRITRPGPWREALIEVLQAARVPHEADADRMDRLCERLVLESLLPGHVEESADRSEPRLDTLQEQIASAPQEPFDLGTEARRMGMSAQTLRRHWMRQIGIPPARYLSEARMKAACRRLVETDLPVGEIAAGVGYDDPLYFSRKFRQRFRVSATTYRKRNRT